MAQIERVKIEVEIEVDLDCLAKQFAELTDDAQARFLCLVASRLGKHADDQAWHIGRHLMQCACSTKEGRDFVREIALGMEP